MRKRRGEDRDPAIAISRARGLLLEGKVEAGFGVLDEAWKGRLPTDPAEWIGFAAESVQLGIVYRQFAAVRRWIQTARRALRHFADCAEVASRRVQVDGLQALFQAAIGETVAARAFFRRCPPAAWSIEWPTWHVLANGFLVLLILEQRFAEFDSFLRSRPSGRPRLAGFDRGQLQALLAFRLQWTGDLHGALRVFQNAQATLLRCGTPEALVRWVVCRSREAVIRAEIGDPTGAAEVLTSVDESCQRLKSVTADGVRAEAVSRIRRARGELHKALPPLMQSLSTLLCEPRDGRRKGRLSLWALERLLASAFVALRAGRLREARALCSLAAPHVRRCEVPSTRAQYYLVKGHLELAISTAPRSLAMARRAFDAADRELQPELLKAVRLAVHFLLGRGWIAYHEGDIAAAARYGAEILDLARGISPLVADGYDLLFHSVLLLEQNLERERLYEHIIRRLGRIEDREMLFRVVANLYVYSFNDAKDLDLMDLHMRQIEAVAKQLPPERFRELYERHVSLPILERFGRKAPPA